MESNEQILNEQQVQLMNSEAQTPDAQSPEKSPSATRAPERQRIKENMATSAGSALGATAGVVVGNLVSSSLRAAEVEVVEAPAPDDASPAFSDSISAQPAVPVAPAIPSIEAAEPVSAAPAAADDALGTSGVTLSQVVEGELINYETYTLDNGSRMDVAMVAVEGRAVGVVDADMDGMADLVAYDANGNFSLEDNEVYDISAYQVSMQPFQQAAAEAGGQIAFAEQDYVNNADVDDYMG